MFATLDQVPEPLRPFYCLETRSEQQFDEDGAPLMQDVDVPSVDEQGNPITITVPKPVFADVDYVVERPRGERKSWDDIWRVAKKHAGKRDDLLAQFVAMAANTDAWAFHDAWLAWFLSRPAEPVESGEADNPDTEIAEHWQAGITPEMHDEAVAAWEAAEPTRPAIVTWESFKAANCKPLREVAYLPNDKQLEMMNDDLRNGTHHWLDHQDAVKAQYPE